MRQSMQIKLANADMIPSLHYIWRQCFEDADDYVALFFNRRFPMSRALTAWVGDVLAGVVYLLDAEINGRPLWYGYAVGTLPEFRGMGVSRRLHDEIFRMAKAQGALYAVHPQGNHLIRFYEKLGMKPGFLHKFVTICVKPDDVEEFSLTTLSASSYARLRDVTFAAPDFVCWDTTAVEYAMEENAFCGGFCRALTDGVSVWVLFGNVQGEVLFLRETTMPDDVILHAAPLLLREFGCKTITLRLPVHSQLDGTIEMSGMVWGEDSPNCGYLNLMLD